MPHVKCYKLHRNPNPKIEGFFCTIVVNAKEKYDVAYSVLYFEGSEAETNDFHVFDLKFAVQKCV